MNTINDGFQIDIIVPTYNRLSEIKKFIHEITKQTYNNYKVYIIDDCGNVNIENILPKDSEKFHYEKLKINSGQALARNYGVSICQGDIIIFMDDDAWFLEPNALEKVSHYFDFCFDLGCLMFDVKEPSRAWLSDRHNLKDLQEIGEFIACGCAFRAKHFKNTSGFRASLHSYAEETDLSIQLIKNGSKIKFGKEIKLFHNYNPAKRDIEWLKRFKHNSVRNDLLIVLTRFPALFVLPFFLGKILSHVIYTIIKEQHFPVNLLQIFKAVGSSIKLFEYKDRNALSLNDFQYWIKKRF